MLAPLPALEEVAINFFLLTFAVEGMGVALGGRS